jgi:hypothetical protein
MDYRMTVSPVVDRLNAGDRPGRVLDSLALFPTEQTA